MTWKINTHAAIGGLACLVLAALTGTAGLAAETEPHSGAPAGASRFARVWRISGSVTAAPANPADGAAPRRLQAGDALYVGEQISAAADGQAVLQTLDAGYIAVRPGASFAMEQFVAEKSADDRFALRLLQGGLRLITGWVARLQPKAYRITTRTATVGVRGTDHETWFLSEELARSLAQPPGTYDKVNRGGTALQTSAGSTDIAPGKVGFARLVGPKKMRALITLTLPVILEQVPGFYLPGPFDAELDALALLPPAWQPALAPEPGGEAANPSVGAPVGALASAPANGPAGAAAAAASDTSASAPSAPPVRLQNGQCNAQAVAAYWLAQLDGALVRHDAAAVLALFAPAATVSASVKNPDGGMATLRLSREEFAASSTAALGGLSQFSQQRLSLSARPLQAGRCEPLALRSEVSEQGQQNGKAYGVKSSETYQLELQDGRWLAVKASTRQR